MKCILVLTVILSAFASSASAGPLVAKDVSADAKWYGHVDCDALRSMKLVVDMKEMFPGHQGHQAKMDELTNELGMNPEKDVSGVTIYADAYGEDIGVALIYVKKLDREKILAMLKKKHPDHKTSQYGDRKLYEWTITKHGRTIAIAGAFASDMVVVIGSGADQVKAALDVVDGKKPGLTKDAALLKGMPQDALLAGRAIEIPEEFRKSTRCTVLRDSTSATGVWTEKDGQITGRYEFDAVSEEMASAYKAVAAGFVAMGELRYHDVPGVKKVMDGLKLDVKGTEFTATFTTSTDDVEAAIKSVMALRKPHQPARAE